MNKSPHLRAYFLKMKNKINLLLVILLLSFSCQNFESDNSKTTDPLPSWNEVESKANIIQFVEQSTDPTGPRFIAESDRIATFDNDGTLWSEKPFYFQLFFVIDRIKENASKHPEWKTEEPYKSILENNIEGAFAQGEEALLKLVMGADADIPVEEFYKLVNSWMKDARHPRFDKPFKQLIYQPMVELLDYLRANDFKVFIVSGGGIDFMRPWVYQAYGISGDQVVGSGNKTTFEELDGRFEVVRSPQIDFIDDKEGKPIGIMRNIGKRPVFAAGNSDGDLAMLQFTSSNDNGSFMLYVHHTDSVREWAYDRNSSVGRLDKGLDIAQDQSWTVVDMKKDWKVIYPFEKN